MVKTVKSDVLIIGGGMAASTAAVAAADNGAETVLVDKGTFTASGSSPVGLHGLANTINPIDSPDLLYEDLLRAGNNLNEQNLIWEAAKGAKDIQRLLESIGILFLKKPDGEYWFFKGVGHSQPRCLSVDPGAGLSPQTVMGLEAWKRGVKLHDNITITKILGDKDGVTGAFGVTRDGKYYLFESKAVVLAAGGANSLYPNSCQRIQDPKYRTVGDSFKLAFDIGAPLIDMEFPNFREGASAGIPIVGGHLINSKGERFMKKYGPSFREGAPRGKIVEAIYNEVLEGNTPIYWQLPEKIPEMPKARHPGRYDEMDGKRIEVMIDFQSLLGGAKINEKSETPIMGLYSAGEAAGGFHGSDRLMSIRFLECTIFGNRAGLNAAEYASKTDTEIDVCQVNEEVTRINEIRSSREGAEPSKIFEAVRNTMWKHCSVTKEADEMERCLEMINGLREKKIKGDDVSAALDSINIAFAAEIVTRASLYRKETRGMHIRRDYRERDDVNWLRHVAIENRDGKVAISTIPITRI